MAWGPDRALVIFWGGLYTSSEKTPKRPLAWQLNPSLTSAVRQRTLPEGTPASAVFAGDVGPNNTFVAVGYTHLGYHQPVLYRLGPTQALVRATHTRPNEDVYANGIVARGDGAIISYGVRVNGRWRAQIQQIDANDKPVWTRTWSDPGRDIRWFGGMKETAGKLLLSGDDSKAGDPREVIAIMDPWAQTNWQLSGKCFGKTVKDCDDNNPCTVDHCEGATGCKHDNVADGTDCGGGKKCAAGACK